MTKDEQEEREYFVEQVMKEVVSLMDDRKLTMSEALRVTAAISEAIEEEMEGRE
jgi:hypothetical protein